MHLVPGQGSAQPALQFRQRAGHAGIQVEVGHEVLDSEPVGCRAVRHDFSERP
jgi:hypothetical protein